MVVFDVWQIFGLANPTQHRINIKQTLYPIVSLHHTVLVVEYPSSIPGTLRIFCIMPLWTKSFSL